MTPGPLDAAATAKTPLAEQVVTPASAGGTVQGSFPEMPSLSEDQGRWLALWMKTEDIAMHFNQLIMSYRLKAVGGLTIAAGLLGTVLLNDGASPTAFHAKAFSLAMLFLLFVWVGIALIDFLYYQELLSGAALEAARLEQLSGGAISLSSSINHAVHGKCPGLKKAFRWSFYWLPIIALSAAFVVGLCTAPAAAPPTASSSPSRSPGDRALPGHPSP